MSIIKIKNLSFSYEKQKVLQDIDLKVEDGDFFAVIGPNGGGKSTLLKLILGFLEPDCGEIKVFGKSPKKALERIGYVPQNTNINVNFPIKVLEVVMMGHVKSEEEKKREGFLGKFFDLGYSHFEKSCALNALKQVGMEEFADKKIGLLSGGQRQRVMIARALCAHPSLLILDEPTASIDSDGQKKIYDLLKELNKTITIMVVSHDISVILGYANKVAHINKKLVFHDISQTHSIKQEGHFCEVEMLEMLGEKRC